MIYEPREDSYLLSRNLKKYVKGKKFLDMGSGSGIQSETALKAGALSVLAVDSQEDVISLLKEKKLPSIKSNLFENIHGKYEVIAFNPPYLPEDSREPQDSKKTTTGGKKGYEITLKFLRQCPKHLEKNGKALLILSSLTPKTRILSLLKKLNFKYKVIDREKLFMESLELWEIDSR